MEGGAGEWGGDGVCERVFGKDKGRGLWPERELLSQTGKQVWVDTQILMMDL